MFPSLTIKTSLLKKMKKISKYKDLKIEINRMWNVKTRVDPVVVGALGMLKRLHERNGVDTRSSQGFGESKNLLAGHCPHFTESAWRNR